MTTERVQSSAITIGSLVFLLLIGFQNCSSDRKSETLPQNLDNGVNQVDTATDSSGVASYPGSVDPQTAALCFSQNLSWSNQSHEDSGFSFGGSSPTPKEFASCQDRDFIINHTIESTSNRICWQQGSKVVDNATDQIIFKPLLPNHAGTYRVREFSDNATLEIVFEIIPIDCNDPFLTRLPDSQCQAANIDPSVLTFSQQEMETEYNVAPTIGANGGKPANTPIKFFKDCKTELSQFTNFTVLPLSELSLGLYQFTWKNEDDHLKVSHFKIIP